MIKRIVRLSFQSEQVKQFVKLFNENKNSIRSFPGCMHLELLTQQGEQTVFFTLSHWESLEDLENYRQSELFRSTWKETKKMFNDRPQAWSLQLVDSVHNEG